MKLDCDLKCSACGSTEFELQNEISELDGFIDAPCRECGKKVTVADIEKLETDVSNKLGDFLSKRFSQK